jgi:hypothetical protein
MSVDGLKVASLIKKIANSNRTSSILMGKVVAGSYDAATQTCSVLLSIDDEEHPTEGVMINGVTSMVNGIICQPKDNSIVWVAEVDGEGKYGIIKTSELEKYTLTIGDSIVTVDATKVEMLHGAAKVLIQDADGVQIMKGGSSLKDVFDNLIDEIKLITVPTGTGPSGVPINTATFDVIKDQFDNLIF